MTNNERFTALIDEYGISFAKSVAKEGQYYTQEYPLPENLTEDEVRAKAHNYVCWLIAERLHQYLHQNI